MVKSLLRSMLSPAARAHVRRWLDVLDTEWHYRLHRRRIRARLEQLRRVPRGLHVEGTNICNARCVFCAYPQMERRKQTMSMDDFRRVVGQYLEMGGRHVSLTPIVGDPFVDKHMFERLDHLMALEQVSGISFYTNAILMTPEKSERLLDYASKLHVHVSWGGFDAETWNTIMGVEKFEAARDAVLALLELKERTGSKLRFTLALRCPDSNRKGELHEKLEAYRKRGLVEIAPMGDYDSWAGKVRPEELEKVGLVPREMPYKRGACELLFTKPVVLADGRVNACACRDVEAELIVGNVNEEPLGQIWAGARITELIERHERGDYPEVCQRCTYFVSVYNSRKSRTFGTDGKLAGNWAED
ncbi:MAG: radical SAM protein [Planctomycetota bacterium]|nr:radical SAM protein [Planctomycetota bacterium]